VTLDTELEDAKGKVWLRCAICPLDPLQNSNPRIVIEGIDISNQTRDQAALRTANERLSLVLNVASVAVWVTSADGSAMLEVTDSIKRIYGRSADEFRSTPSLWLDVVHPDDRNIAMRSLVDINVMGHSLSEYRIIRRDGEVRWVLDEKSLIRDASGNVVQLGGAVHDVTERREAEEALKQLNAELEARVRQRTDELARESEFSRSLLNSIPFGMAIIDKDCRVLFLNDRLAKQTGPDAIGKPCFMSLRHDHRQPEECPIKLGRKGQNTGSFEATGMISGRVVSITHTPIVFQGLDATLELYEDVSERSRAERLRKSRLEFLEESVTLSPQAFLRRALDEMCSHTESQLAFYLEVENSERLVMRAWSPVSLGETYDLLRTGIEYRVTEVESWAECIRLQQPVTRNDTDAAPVSQVRSHPHLACTRELVVPVVRGKRVVGIVAVRNRPQDYTDADLATVSFLADVAVELYVRRQQEEVIAEQRKLFDFVFERALAGFWDWTLQSGAMRMSERFKAVLGYKTEELPDTIEAWKCLIHPEDLEMVLERHRAIIDLRRDGTISFDLRYVHRNGSTVWVSWIGTVVENAEDGRPRRLVGCQIDITQTKHMEQALRATQEAAATANIAKGVFLANMSHEIRTPMNAVLGFTQLLLRNHETTTVQRRYLEIINRAGDHLLFLIDQILQIAKIESGHATLEENTVDVSQLLSDLRHFFASRVATKAFAFAVTSDAHCPRYIVTDEGKLRQILFNLIGNAIKFTELGRVTFHTAIKRDDTQAWITFEISDTGPGIAAQDLPRLFRKFEQTDTGRRTKQGTGLGLAISQEFAQLMGGGITLESAVGCGSRFTVTLPLRVGSRSDFRPLKRPRVVRRLRPFQEKIRALVVDDNTDNLSFAVGLLESVGFTTAQAINGRDAIDVYVNWHPHLILMDMRMPVLDGAEATRQIRAIPGGHAVKIIAVTANAFEEDKEAALKTGVNDFLRKPYREHELFEKISELLGVTYEYDDESAPSLAVAPRVIDDSVIREQLCDFPKDLRRQLLHAAIVADLDSFIQLLAKAKNFNATAAQALQFLAEGFDYKRIRALLELGDNDAG
jgi:PAS domain S-box-containing protein